MPYYRYFPLSGEHPRVVKEGEEVTKVGDNLVLTGVPDAHDNEGARTFKPHCEGVWEHTVCVHDWNGEESFLVLLEVPTVVVKTAKVVVEPVVTAGTERGGEDLDFHFRLDLVEPHHRVGPDTVLKPVWEEGNVTFFAPGEGLEDYCPEEDDDEFFTARLKWQTGLYELEWTGTPVEALQLTSKNYSKDDRPVETVEQRLRELGSRSPHVTVVHFVNGNAE